MENLNECTNLVSKLILEKYSSKKSFADSIGIPYTTLKGMLERGIGQSSTNLVIKVCDGLGITVDELIKMAEGSTVIHDECEIQTIAAHHDDDNNFTEDELQEIEEFKEFVKNKKKNRLL